MLNAAVSTFAPFKMKFKRRYCIGLSQSQIALEKRYAGAMRPHGKQNTVTAGRQNSSSVCSPNLSRTSPVSAIDPFQEIAFQKALIQCSRRARLRRQSSMAAIVSSRRPGTIRIEDPAERWPVSTTLK
jgi:hypothetical protein